MLKKLLPISKIKEKLKNLPKSKSSKEEDFSVKGANLLSDSGFLGQSALDKKDPRSYYETPTFVKSVQLFIVVFSVAFLVLSLANLFLDSRIKKQEAVVSRKARELSAIKPTLVELSSISEKVSLLKTQRSSAEDLSPYVELFLNSSNHFTFESFKLNSSLASFSATTPSPVSFSLAAEQYLDSGLVENIILTTASLDQENDLYELSVEVNLK